MEATTLSKEEAGQRARTLYAHDIRSQVETEDNISKMVIIDVERGDYEVGDDTGIEAARQLYARHPNARLFGLRIGYNVAAALGGVMK